MNTLQAYILSKKYTDETASQFGGLKGANCTIKSIVNQDGQNIVTFEWINNQGEARQSEMIVQDGTPIYEWQSGDLYKYGDLVIYQSCFYRCIVENRDSVFDNTKWNEIGSPDGNYDIVQNSSLLPSRFTAADRKMYYSIVDEDFWLWDGTKWVRQAKDSKPETITWDEWSELDPAEKEGTHYLLTGVPAQFSTRDAIFSLKNQTLVFTNKQAIVNNIKFKEGGYVFLFYATEEMAQVAKVAGLKYSLTNGSIVFTVDNNPTSDITLDILCILPSLAPGGSGYTQAETDTLLAAKVDKVTGKQLSTEDFTNELKLKLEGIEAGAKVNVQSDWNQSNLNADDFIKNKPTSLADFSNDPGFVTSTVDNLVNYYTKTQTYTQTEINNLIAAINAMTIEFVQSLPTTDIDIHTIYFVPKQTPEQNDYYDEYVNTNGTTSGWERVGSTQIDLNNYYTKTEIDSLLSEKVSKSGGTMNGQLVLIDMTNPIKINRSNSSGNSGWIDFYNSSGLIGQYGVGSGKRAIFSTGDGGSIKILAFTDEIPTDFVPKSSGGTFGGDVGVDKQNGSTSTVGGSYVVLGNNIAVGTAKNSRGILQLYGRNEFYGQIYDHHGLTENRNYYLPDKTGTLALTSDIPTELPANGGNADTATKATQDASGNVITSTYLNKNSTETQVINANVTIGSTLNKKDVTIWGTTTFRGGAVTFMGDVVASAKVSIPYNKLFLTNGSSDRITFNDTSGATSLRTYTFPNKSGTFAMTSDISSRKFKENINKFTDEEAKKLLDVEMVTFDYKEGVIGEDERYDNRGVIAEQVEPIIPYVVEHEIINDEEQLRVDYRKFIPYLIKMVQIQQKEINELKNKLEVY